MTKYMTAREAYVDYLTGVLTELPIDSKGRLLEKYDGNDYSGNPNHWPDLECEEDEEGFDDEIFDPNYHDDYFDVDEDEEYEYDENYDCCGYLDCDCWHDECEEDNEEDNEEDDEDDE